MAMPEMIKSTEDLLSIADAMERESAARYRALAAHVRRQGEAVVAAEFEALAALEDRHVDELEVRVRSALGRPPRPAPEGRAVATAFDDEEARRAMTSGYQALAFAVRNEERAFAFYTYVAAAADNEAVRALAEDLARDELDHASRLRRLRRKAFHLESPVGVEIPGSVEALRDLVRRWEKRGATAHAGLADRLERAGQGKEADVFRRLSGEEEAAAADAPLVEFPMLASVAAGLRLLEETFDRLALIGERSKDERVVAEAQRLAQRLVARLALAGQALGADPTVRRDA